ncbi:MAG: penicillin-binding transpeptidase domain-containing protein [Sarcina sp.]
MKNKKIKRNKKSDRFNGLIGVMCVIFSAIILKLLYLQVFNFDDYKERADNRAMRFISDKAPRGKIYDQNGNVLATNKQTYNVTFEETKEAKKNFYSIVDSTLKILDESGEKLQDNLQLIIDENGQFAFNFGANNESNLKALELRFKKDRGLDEKVRRKFYPKEEGDLSEDKVKKINETVMAITPEQTFEYLIEQYDLKTLLIRDQKFNSVEEEREFKKKFKEQYKDKTGKEILDELLQTYSLEQIRKYVLIKDSSKMQSYSSFKAITLAKGIKEDTALIFYQKLNDLPGVDISLDPVRYYPYGDLASSVIGYMGAIPGTQKNKYADRGYDLSSDLVGKSGIESALEDQLRGTKGGVMAKVDVQGKPKENLYSIEATPGNSVTLTIDKDVQASAEKMLKTQLEYRAKTGHKNTTRGAAIALKVDTGEVLALASYPGFDPNAFASGNVASDEAKNVMTPDLESFGADYIKKMGLNKTVDELFPKDENGYRQDIYDVYPKPMYNYATLGMTQPGSTFKPLTSVVALEEEVMGLHETVSDGAVLDGGLSFIKYANLIGTPKDNKNHGTVDVRMALQRSCNSFYYETAVRLYRKYDSSIKSLDSIAKYAWKFGLGKDPKSNTIAGTGIEISENFGNVYNFESFKKNTIYYMRWELVEAMRVGNFPKANKFIPVEIGKNDGDSKEVADAKQSYKDIVEKYLSKIGEPDFASMQMKEDFMNEAKASLNGLYNVIPAYKEAIDARLNENKKLKIDSFFQNTAQETYDWMTTTVKMSVSTPAELAFSAIGQSTNAFTPTQLASYIATLVNGGTRYKVTLVDKISDYNGNVITDYEPVVLDKIDMKDSTVDAVKQGMNMVNHDAAGGTGYSVFGNFPLQTGGKTGTATFRADQAEFGRSAFGVYVSFAPVEKPEIAVAVVMYDAENGYFGAPVARAIYETYWRDKLKAEYPGYKPRTMAGEEYDYTLNPDTPNIKDNEIIINENPADENSAENPENNNPENTENNNQ